MIGWYYVFVVSSPRPFLRVGVAHCETKKSYWHYHSNAFVTKSSYYMVVSILLLDFNYTGKCAYGSKMLYHCKIWVILPALTSHNINLAWVRNWVTISQQRSRWRETNQQVRMVIYVGNQKNIKPAWFQNSLKITCMRLIYFLNL